VVEDAIAAAGAAEIGRAGAADPTAFGAARPAAPVGPVAPGDRVLIAPLGLEGDLESVQGDEATVLVRGRRVRVASSALAPAS
jgi:hypothetical protein